MTDTLLVALKRWLPARALPASQPELRARAECEPAVDGLEPVFVANLRSMGQEFGERTVSDLVSGFASSTKNKVSALREAFRRGDLASMKMLAHGLKGSTATFRAEGLAEICAELEANLVAERREGVERSLGRLESAFEWFPAALEVWSDTRL